MADLDSLIEQLEEAGSTSAFTKAIGNKLIIIKQVIMLEWVIM